MARKRKVTSSALAEFQATLRALLISAFGLVAALIWRDAVQAFFTDVLGITWGADFQSTFIVAVGVTIILVILTLLLGKFVWSADLT